MSSAPGEANGSGRAAVDPPGGVLPWLALAALAIYAPSLSLGLWREDWLWVFGPFDFPGILFDWANPDTIGRYRPLAKLVMAASGAAGIEHLAVTRAVAVALAGSAAAAVGLLVRALGGNRWAALVAGLVYLASHRMAVVATAATQWPAQLSVVFSCAALAAMVASRARPRLGLAVPAAALAAIASFEAAVNLPLALAAVAFAVHGPRARRRSLVATAVAAGVVGGVTALHLAADDAPGSHRPSIGAVARNLRFALDHESGILAAAALAAAWLAWRRRGEAVGALAAVTAIGLFPGLLFPKTPDTYVFVLCYAGGAGLVGLAVSELLARGLPDSRAAALGVASLLVAVGSARGWHGVAGLIEREPEMARSRAFVEDVLATGCFRGGEAWIAPLGLDPLDRRGALVTPDGGLTPLTAACGTPVRFAEDPFALAERDDCRERGYFLTRAQRLVSCAELLDAGEGALVEAVACGAPRGSPDRLELAGAWSGLEPLCYSVSRGEGVDPEHPAVWLEGDVLRMRGKASATVALEEGPGITGVRFAVHRNGVGAPEVYYDGRLVTAENLGVGGKGIDTWMSAPAALRPRLVSFVSRPPDGDTLTLLEAPQPFVRP